MITSVIGVPGIQSGSTVSYRQVFRQPESVLYLPGGGWISSVSRDYGNDNPLCLRAGLPMGRITASPNRWAPSVIGKVGTAYASGTTLNLTAASAAEVVRRQGTTGTFKLTGPPAANGLARTSTVTYSAINTTTGDATITALGANEVQTVNLATAATGGSVRLLVPKTDGTTALTPAAAWSATDATLLSNLQTALDTATGVANGIVATAISATDTDLGFVLTYSGTGYAGLTWPLAQVHTLYTGNTGANVVRTTTGSAAAFVSGSFAQPTDGSETPVSVIPDGSGLLLAAGNHLEFPQIAYRALLQTSGIVDYPADTGLRTWLRAAMNTYGTRFEFDDLTLPA